MSRAHRLLTVALATLLCLTAAGSVAATAQHGGQQDHDGAVDAPAVVVGLNEDGSATVTVSFTYNLSDEDRKQAFEDLRDSESERNEFRDRFAARMASVATASENETGREMSVEDASLAFRTADDIGIVEASVTWNGLAAVEGDQLTVTEPFASGFESERPVHVLVPEGYAVDSVEPAADAQTDGHLTWDAGTDLAGFEVVVSAAESDDGIDDGMDGDETTESDGMDDSETDDNEMDGTDDGETTESAGDGASGPGFGVLAAVGALLAIAGLARLRG